MRKSNVRPSLLRRAHRAAAELLRRVRHATAPCRREQLGYQCHAYLPQGCEMCGRTERRPYAEERHE